MYWIFNETINKIREITGLPAPDDKGWIHTACPVCGKANKVSLWADPPRTNLTVACWCEHADIVKGLGLEQTRRLEVLGSLRQDQPAKRRS